MKLRTVALAGASLLAMTAHASADPVSIGFFLFAGPLGSVFSFSALVTAAQIGLYGIGIGASLLTGALNQPGRIDPGQYKNTFETGESSEVNAIGRVRLGGLKAFGNTKGPGRYRLIWHCKGRLDAVEQHFLGGREVTVEADGAVSSPPYAKPDLASWVYIRSKPGDGTETAWTDLMSEFPTLWTPDHKCQGIFQSNILYISPGFTDPKFVKMFQGGEPDYTNTSRVNHCYDPRDAGQDRNDDTTWLWTINGVLCAARIMLSYPDLTVADFDWDFIADEAAKADEVVATKTGTEARSRCSGVWLSESKRGETMQQVLDSIGAEIVLTDEGLIRIRLIDDRPTPEIEFLSQPHVTSFSWKSGPEAVERPNLCVVKYYSPEINYEMGEVDMTGIAWARIDDEVARYGEKPFTVELPFCFSASQAQRIARRMFLSARADTGVIRTNMAGLAAWGLTYASIEDDTAAEMMTCKMAPPRVDDAAGEVEIPFIVWPEMTAWEPSTDEAAAPEQVPPIENESPLEKPDPPSEYALVQYIGGGAYETRIRFLYVDGAATAEAVYREYSGGNPGPFQSMSEYQSEIDPTQTAYAYVTDNTGGQEVDFKVRWFNLDEEGSYFSDLLNVPLMAIDNTTPSALVLTNNAGTLEVGTEETRVVQIRIEYQPPAGSYSTLVTWDVRPGEIKTQAISPVGVGTHNYRAYAKTSNGTDSAVSNIISVVV
jgi:hypothetical protein